MPLDKHLVIVFAAFAVALTCAAAEPPKLDKAEVLQIAMDYAHQRKWDVKHVWRDMPVFDDARQQWQVFMTLKQYGITMIVIVNDKTKEVSFEQGE